MTRIVNQTATQRNYSRNQIQELTQPKRRGPKPKRAKEIDKREENPTIFHSNGFIPGIDIPNQLQQSQIQPYQSQQAQFQQNQLQQSQIQLDQLQSGQFPPDQLQQAQFQLCWF